MLNIKAFINPGTKTGQRGCYSWNAECNALQRGISPGFVVGRKYRNIKTNKGIIIRKVENAITAVEIGRHKDHSYFIIHSIVQSFFPEPRDTGVLVFIKKVM